MNNELIILIAGILGGLGVILGAFGSHALKKTLTADQLVSYEIGVRYQIYHALLLLFVGSTSLIGRTYKVWIVCLVVFGVLMFSGSIYILNLRKSGSSRFKYLWPVTPVGGILLIIAWLLVGFSVFCH